MGVPGEERIAALCGMMNDAAVGAGRWLDYVQALRTEIGADVATIEIVDRVTGAARVIGETPIGDAAMREYEERIIFVNPRLSRPPDLRVAQVQANRHMPAEFEQKAGEFNDWAERHRLPYWFAGGMVLDTSDYFAISAIQRDKRRGPADLASEAVLERLLGHLANALHVEQALAPRGDAPAILDRASLEGEHAYALVDPFGGLSEMSIAFERIVAASGTLVVVNGRLAGRRPRDRKTIDRLLSSVLVSPPPEARPAPVRLPPPGPGHGLLLRAIRLHNGRELFERLRPAALLVLTDLDAPAATRAADLRALWGLTEREAELALALANGRTLGEAAYSLGMGEGTARHHLKGIFRRMEIDRQADLVRLVARVGG